MYGIKFLEMSKIVFVRESWPKWPHDDTHPITHYAIYTIVKYKVKVPHMLHRVKKKK